MTVTTKIAKNGTQMYYVDGKRVSRENALEAAAINREGKSFTVEYNDYNYAKVDKLEVKVQQAAHRYDVIFNVMVGKNRVALPCAYKLDKTAIKNARTAAGKIVDAIAAAYINGASVVKIVGNTVEVKAEEPVIVEAMLDNFKKINNPEPAIAETANEELDGYNPDVFSLLPKLEDLNDVDGEFDEDAAEYTDRDDRYNRGEKIAEGLTAKLRAFDPTVEVTFAIDDDEDTYYLSYDGIARTPFTATGVETSFHAMKQYDAETDCPPEPPTPKPNSPFDIARGLNDVFQKTFHRVDAPYLDVLTQDGAKIVTNFGATFISVDWSATDGYVFGNHSNDVLARYETPEQVTDVMTALRDAIRAGKTEFTFPTVEALTASPEPETPATAVEETDREKFLKAKEQIKAAPDKLLDNGNFTTKWLVRDEHGNWNRTNKGNAANILNTFGLDIFTYLDEKAKWVADEIKRGSRQFAIDMQAEFLRNKIDADRKSSVEPMPALYPSDDSDDDDELIDAPEVKATADEFTAKLAAFDAEITHAETARDAAKAAYEQADADALKAFTARWKFLESIAGDLTRKLHETCIDNEFIETTTTSGCTFTIGDFDNIYIDATTDSRFVFVTWNNRILARYDTPAQVEAVINLLKDAVERHKPVFHFPTVDELIDPPVKPADAAHISDSLTRAMKTALEKFQGFCLVKNLTAAENELKLYNICREATQELWGVTA